MIDIASQRENMIDVIEQIKVNTIFGKTLETILSPIDVPEENHKAMLFTAFLQDSLSHFYSINILIDKKLYNSAFALVRVFFDTLVRGQYLVYIMEDTLVNSMYNENIEWKFPKTKNMCKELDTFFDEQIFDNIRTATYEMMCDYTHIGRNQIARHFNDAKATVEPNFSIELILDTLKSSSTLMKLFAKNYIAFMQDSELLDKSVSLA